MRLKHPPKSWKHGKRAYYFGLVLLNAVVPLAVMFEYLITRSDFALIDPVNAVLIAMVATVYYYQFRGEKFNPDEFRQPP